MLIAALFGSDQKKKKKKKKKKLTKNRVNIP